MLRIFILCILVGLSSVAPYHICVVWILQLLTTTPTITQLWSECITIKVPLNINAAPMWFTNKVPFDINALSVCFVYHYIHFNIYTAQICVAVGHFIKLLWWYTNSTYLVKVYNYNCKCHQTNNVMFSMSGWALFVISLIILTYPEAISMVRLVNLLFL